MATKRTKERGNKGLGRAGAAKASKPKPPGPKKPAAPKRFERGVAAVASEIRSLQSEDGSDSVAARVSIGQKLSAVKQELAHGDWLRFLSEEVGYAFRSAQRLIQLGQWAPQNARLVGRVRHWGPTKVYHLMDAGPEVARRLLSRKEVEAPNSGRLKRLELLTAVELKALIEILKTGDSAGSPDDDEESATDELMRKLMRDSARVIRSANKLKDMQASGSTDEGMDKDELAKARKRLLRSAKVIEKMLADA